MKVHFHEKLKELKLLLLLTPFVFKIFQMRNMIQFLLRLIQSHHQGSYLGELQKKGQDFQATLTLKRTFVLVNLSCEPCLQSLQFK